MRHLPGVESDRTDTRGRQAHATGHHRRSVPNRQMTGRPAGAACSTRAHRESLALSSRSCATRLHGMPTSATHSRRSRPSLRWVVLRLLALLTPVACSRARSEVAWPVGDAVRAGLDTAELHLLQEELARRGTTALLIALDGRLVVEWYGPGHHSRERLWGASLAKSMVGGLSLVLALQERRLLLGDTAAKWIPDWQDDSARAAITIEQLASHTSGLANGLGEPPCPSDDHPDWADRFWKRKPNPFATALHETPLCATPGQYLYSSPGFAALAYAVTAAIRETATPNIARQLKSRLMIPLGIPAGAWSLGYRKTYRLDGLTLYASWGGVAYTARAAARLGQLMADYGRWNGQPILDSAWVGYVTSCAEGRARELSSGAFEPAPVLGWWSNCGRAWPSLPSDAIAARGSGHQIVLAVPSLRLVVARFGGRLDPAAPSSWAPVEQFLYAPLIAALRHSGG